MASSTVTSFTTVEEEVQKFADEEITRGAKAALGDQNVFWPFFWAGVEKFIDWFRTKVADFLANQLQHLPVIGKWASRIGTTVTESLLGFLSTVFSNKQVWEQAHQVAMVAWISNKERGLSAQSYAYGRKMAGYFLEIIKQCLVRAIRAHGFDVSETEGNEISTMLDDILTNESGPA